MDYAGRTFVVTGAGNGIGQQVVLELLRRDARVAGVDRSEQGLQHTAELAATWVSRLSLHTLDITDAAAVSALPTQVHAVLGAVDGLFNVAGIVQPFVRFVDLSMDDVDRVMQVNFWGVVTMCKAFLPELLTREQSCLVNVSSMGGFTPVPGQTAYGASKAAVKLFTEGLYAETRGSNLRVSVVFPGAIGTEIVKNSGVQTPGDAGEGESSFPTTAADAAARIILDGVAKGKYRILVGKDAVMLDRMSRLVPQRATDLIAKRMASLLH